MADRSPSNNQLQGLLLQDHRLTADSFWSAESANLTTASPQPGVPQLVSGDSDAVLHTSGTQSDGGSLDILCSRAGYSGGESYHVGRYLWKNTSDGSTSWRGWDQPTAISGYETVDYDTGAGNIHPHVITLSGGAVLMSYCFESGSNTHVAIRRRAATTGTWGSEVSIYAEPTNAATDPIFSSLLQLPSGRVVIYFTSYDDQNALFNVQMWYSDDDGDTWTRGCRGCLPASFTRGTGANEFFPRRIRVAFNGSAWLMVLWLKQGVSLGVPANPEILVSYASIDGAVFDLVTQWTGTSSENGQVPDIAVRDGVFYVFYAKGLTAYVLRLASAYQNMVHALADELPDLAVDLSGGVYSRGDLAAAVDENGTIYAFGSSQTQTGIGVYSADAGSTWTRLGDPGIGSGTPWWIANDTDFFPKRFAATFQRGRAILVCNWDSNANTADNTLSALYLGGYTQVCMPMFRLFEANGRAWFNYTWTPLDKPDAVGIITASSVGAPTDTLTSAGHEITLALADERYYDETPVTTDAAGLIARATCKVSASGGYNTVRLRIGDGASTGYEIEVRLTSTSVALRDAVAGTQIDSKAVTGTALIQIFAAISGDSGAAWYRTFSTNEDRRWTLIGSSTSLTNGTTTPRVRRGAVSTSGGFTSTWTEFHRSAAIDQPIHLASVPDNPEDLFGRAVPGSGSFVSITDGVRISAVDGPALEGDQWLIASRSDFDVRNILPVVSPSPLRGWRSSSTTADMRLAFDLDQEYGAGSEDSYAGNYTIGCYIEGTNVPYIRWQIYQGGSWSTAVNADLRTSVAYDRKGNAVRPASGAPSSNFYVFRNELVGGHFEFATGDIRRIIGNTEGQWIPTTGGKTCTLFLEGMDATEGASGSGYIWWPRALLIAHLATSASHIRGYGLLLRPGGTGAAPPEAYYAVAKCVMGPMMVWGTSYEGRSLGIEPNVAIETLQDGSRRSRVLGPSRRRMEMSWPMGVPTRRIMGDAPAADDYVTNLTSSGVPIASVHDIYALVDGLVEELSGGHRHVVACPVIPRTTGPTTTAVLLSQHARGALYGRLVTGSTSHEVVSGTEHLNEFIRSGTLAVEEEL